MVDADQTHLFLDEAGDTTFFGKGRVTIVGTPGVSTTFTIGMVRFGAPISQVRGDVVQLQQAIADDPYLNVIPSVAKKIAKGAFHFHATDDPPEVRQVFFKFIKELDRSLEAVVARKDPGRFVRKHHAKDAEFYADVLSHLLDDKLKAGEGLVLTIAQRADSTKQANLARALDKATERVARRQTAGEPKAQLGFNVQSQRTEPLLNVADYLCWAVQRVFERAESRYYDFIADKAMAVLDLYGHGKKRSRRVRYSPLNPLSVQKINPPSA